MEAREIRKNTGKPSERGSQRAFADHLFSNAKPLDYGPIPCSILILQVIEKATALSDHPQKAPAGMMILGMDLKMLGQIPDLFAQDGDLNLRRTGIAMVSPIGFYYFLLSFYCK